LAVVKHHAEELTDERMRDPAAELLGMLRRPRNCISFGASEAVTLFGRRGARRGGTALHPDVEDHLIVVWPIPILRDNVCGLMASDFALELVDRDGVHAGVVLGVDTNRRFFLLDQIRAQRAVPPYLGTQGGPACRGP
jgi:hypothetical protein